MGRTACTEPQCLYKGDLYVFFYMIKNTELLHVSALAGPSPGSTLIVVVCLIHYQLMYFLMTDQQGPNYLGLL